MFPLSKKKKNVRKTKLLLPELMHQKVRLSLKAVPISEHCLWALFWTGTWDVNPRTCETFPLVHSVLLWCVCQVCALDWKSLAGSVTESVMTCGWRDIMNKAITDHNIGNRDDVIQLSYIGLIIIIMLNCHVIRTITRNAAIWDDNVGWIGGLKVYCAFKTAFTAARQHAAGVLERWSKVRQ